MKENLGMPIKLTEPVDTVESLAPVSKPVNIMAMLTK